MELSAEQQKIFKYFKEGKNIFMTGPGGCGKSAVIKYIYNWCNENNKAVQVCALTGCAAILLQTKAKTVHSWAGIGMANGNAADIISRVVSNKYKKRNWIMTNILIIDEISMMSVKLLEILDTIGKQIRKNNKPFGGIQLLFSGDFYQLPPVGDNTDAATKQFCFESEIWNTLFHYEINLTKIFRQNDETYTSILNQIRKGKLRKSGFQQLQNRLVECKDELLKPTKLMPKRFDVNKVNEIELNKIKSNEITYVMTQAETKMFSLTKYQQELLAKIPPQQIEYEVEYLKSSVMAEEKITLKVGAQVMCIVNFDLENEKPIANGSCGIISEFVNGLPVVKFKNGLSQIIGYYAWESEQIKGVGVQQIPLILSWAITIHKAQGTTLELAEIDIGSGVFECGQSYVALSRVKDINGLYLTAFNPNNIKVNTKVIEYYNKLNN